MQRVEIIAKGDVQRVAYRDKVEKIAGRLNITGYVENLKPYNVKIVAEGEEENINKFIEAVKIKKFPIDVESVEVNYKEAKNEFEYFEIKRGEWHEELGERMDFAGTMLYEIKDNTKMMLEKQDKTLEKQDKMLEKQDKMLEKQDKMLEKQDKTLEKQDIMIGKQDTTITSINRLDSNMVQKFDRMDVKYDKVSDKMDSIDHTLQELTRAILKLAEHNKSKEQKPLQ